MRTIRMKLFDADIDFNQSDCKLRSCLGLCDLNDIGVFVLIQGYHVVIEFRKNTKMIKCVRKRKKITFSFILLPFSCLPKQLINSTRITIQMEVIVQLKFQFKVESLIALRCFLTASKRPSTEGGLICSGVKISSCG